MLDVLKPLALQLEASGGQFIDAIRDFPADAWEARPHAITRGLTPRSRTPS